MTRYLRPILALAAWLLVAYATAHITHGRLCADQAPARSPFDAPKRCAP